MRGGAGGVRHPDPAPVQRAGPAGGVLFRQGPARSTAPRAADDAVDRHRHQPAPPLRPSGTGERAGDRDEELRQDPAGVSVRCRPPPRPRARRSRTAVAERSVNVTCPSCETVYRVDPAKVPPGGVRARCRSEEHTSELQSRRDLVCRLLLEKKKKKTTKITQSKQRD